MSFVYDVETSEEESDNDTSDTDDPNIALPDVDDMSQEIINHNHEYLEINNIVVTP